jgi:DNA-binding CsgD family transcriptional regulator
MRESRCIGKMLSVYPNMPLMSLGFWLAWTYLAFNSCSWISSTDLQGIRVTQIYLSATIAMAVVLIGLQAIAPRAAAAFHRPAFPLLGGATSSVGALVVILIGPYVLGGHLSTPVNMGIFLAGAAVAGAGGALVLARVADAFGRLYPRNAIAELALTNLFALALYFVSAGVPIIAIGKNGPGVFQAVMFVLLPLLAGYFASLDKPNRDAGRDPRSTNRKELPGSFWRMTTVVGAFAFSESFLEAYANTALPLADTIGQFPFVVLFQGLASLAFLGLAVAYNPKRTNFGRIVNGVMIASVLCVAACSFAGAYNPPLFRILPFVMGVFNFVYLCMLFFSLFQRHMSGLLVFGASYGLYSACCAAGWAVGTAAFSFIHDASYLVFIGGALALITLAIAFMLFSEKQFDSLFESPDSTQTPLSSLMNHTLGAAAETSTNRGKFNVAIDVVTDKFGLTRREKDVLRQLAMGHDATRISKELGISWNTARSHTRNVYAKLGVHARQEVSDLVDSYKEQ